MKRQQPEDTPTREIVLAILGYAYWTLVVFFAAMVALGLVGLAFGIFGVDTGFFYGMLIALGLGTAMAVIGKRLDI